MTPKNTKPRSLKSSSWHTSWLSVHHVLFSWLTVILDEFFSWPSRAYWLHTVSHPQPYYIIFFFLPWWNKLYPFNDFVAAKSSSRTLVCLRQVMKGCGVAFERHSTPVVWCRGNSFWIVSGLGRLRWLSKRLTWYFNLWTFSLPTHLSLSLIVSSSEYAATASSSCSAWGREYTRRKTVKAI
jgi:hypothetical protein